MFTGKPNNKTIYKYILRTVIIIFVLCAALLKAVAFTPEADNGYIPSVQSDTEKSCEDRNLTWRYNDTVYNDGETYQTGVPVKCRCCDSKACICRQKIPVSRSEANFISDEIQTPCMTMIFSIAAKSGDLTAYDIAKHYEKFLS